MVLQESCVTLALVVVGAKVWYDVLHFAYYRERARACTKIVHEGVELVRFAIERGVLSDLTSTADRVLAVPSDEVRRVFQRGATTR